MNSATNSDGKTVADIEAEILRGLKAVGRSVGKEASLSDVLEAVFLSYQAESARNVLSPDIKVIWWEKSRRIGATYGLGGIAPTMPHCR